MVHSEQLVFAGFILLIVAILIVDLGVFNKKSHVVSFREALGFTLLWVSVAMLFGVLIYFFGDLLHDIKNTDELRQIVQRYSHPITIIDGDFEQSIKSYRHNLSLEYLTGYIIEYSLSVDNIFVILMVFLSFGVETKYYHKVLFWGIVGAILMRFLFIFISSALIQNFEWIMYFFGALLVFTGIKIFIDRNKEEKIDTNNHYVVRLANRFFRVDGSGNSGRFFIRKNGKLFITALFVVLLVIEFTDVIFAVDSVPAIFSITKDPYIVYFSNIFAIIGLRSLFFLISSIIDKFRFLKIGLAALLVFIGLKMMLHSFFEISTLQSLGAVLTILVSSILFSVLLPEGKSGNE